MQKNIKIQTGSPIMLSPQAYYLWYHKRAGLQDAERITITKTSTNDRLIGIIKLYYEIAKKILNDLRPQYISKDEKYNKFLRILENRIDNKLRIDSNGKRFICINNKYNFDGSYEIYEKYFQSGKKNFCKIFKEIVKELIAVVNGNASKEKEKSFIIDTNNFIKKKEAIAVDLDNTIIDANEEPIDGAKDALLILKNKGYKIIIYTARFAFVPQDQWQALISYIEGILYNHEIPFDEISINKPSCKFFVDDRAIKFTNWDDVIAAIEVNKIQEEEKEEIAINIDCIKEEENLIKSFKLLF